MKGRHHLTNQLAVTALALYAGQAHLPPRSGEIKEDKALFIASKTRDFIKKGHCKAVARTMAKKEWRDNRDE